MDDPALVSLLAEAGISAYLSGHHHAYYPGWKAGIAYISQACLGGGPRRLIGDTHRSSYSFTRLIFDAEGSFEVEAFAAPEFVTRIEPKFLPEQISTPVAVLKRLDLTR